MKPYYERNGITIFHADCRDILPTLVPSSVGLVLTDPPYGIDYQHGARRGGLLLGADMQRIVGDDEPFDPIHLLDLAPRLIFWGANHYADRLPASRGWLIWDKRNGQNSNDQSDCELAWTNWLSVARVFSRRWNGNVRSGREQAEGRLHVNQKPVALMAWCIRQAGKVDSLIDPYMGSGTTLLAARELEINAVGIDIIEHNCEIAAKRLEHEAMVFPEADQEEDRRPSQAKMLGLEVSP